MASYMTRVCCALLAAVKHVMDHGLNGHIVVADIREDHPLYLVLLDACAYSILILGRVSFGRLAPYLERLCFRLATPVVSREPRTIW